MSATPQQIINIGEAPNDGTGEPLRTAFAEVNNNFANVWAAGPVNTNVVIANSRVSTGVLDQDLELAGNGLANVVVYTNMKTLTVQPQTDSVYDLGNATAYYDSSYVRYRFGDSLELTGNVTAGDVSYTSVDGTDGQVLTTDGNGGTYWSTPAPATSGSLVVYLRSGTMSEAVTNGFLIVSARTGNVSVPIT